MLLQEANHSHGAIMVYVDVSTSTILRSWVSENIPQHMLFYKRSSILYVPPHITVCYRIPNVTVDDISNIVAGTNRLEYMFGDIGYFEGLDYDIIYIKVISPDMEALGDKVNQTLDIQHRRKNRLHLTLAYLKKSPRFLKGISYFKGIRGVAGSIVFSDIFNNYTTISLSNGIPSGMMMSIPDEFMTLDIG